MKTRNLSILIGSAIVIVCLAVFAWTSYSAEESQTHVLSPASSTRARLPINDTAIQPAASSPPVAVVTGVAASPAAKEWDEAFKSFRQTDIRILLQRAATSGRLVDAIVAKQAWHRCAYKGPEYQIAKYQHPDKLPEWAQKSASNLEQHCAGVRDLPTRDTYDIKDDAGFGELAKELQLLGASPIKDKEQREKLLQKVLDTDSIQLLDYASSTLVTASTMPALGIQPSTELPPTVDVAMLKLAIQIRACNARGDCEQVAQENFQCNDFSACVSDLNRFPEERMFGAKDQRAFLFKGVSDPASEAALRKRWADLQTAVARLGQ
ncbi:MAG: hypothetical protein EOP37_23795 [Rubrivivax sp.]|nr:MAG: hypothetical protein EOP37_23795 [Rubrivivax sp.]